MKKRREATLEDVQSVMDDESLFGKLKDMAAWDVTTDSIEDLETLLDCNPATDPIVDDFENPLNG